MRDVRDRPRQDSDNEIIGHARQPRGSRVIVSATACSSGERNPVRYAAHWEGHPTPTKQMVMVFDQEPSGASLAHAADVLGMRLDDLMKLRGQP